MLTSIQKGDLTHVVKAHSADETAGANHGKTGVDLGNPGNPRFEAGNSWEPEQMVSTPALRG